MQINWPPRTTFSPGRENAKSAYCKICLNCLLLPPLHIKLSLTKSYIKALDKDGPIFGFLRRKFPCISEAKLRTEVFDGPQIRELIKDDGFVQEMSALEKRVWNAFRDVISNFLGKHRSLDYEEQVKELLEGFRALGTRMSVKMHFFSLHLDYFSTIVVTTAKKREEVPSRPTTDGRTVSRVLGCEHACRLQFELKKRSSPFHT